MPESDNPLAEKMLAMDPFASERRGMPDTIHECYVEQAQRDRELLCAHDVIRGMTFAEASYTLDAFIGHVTPAVHDVELAPATA